MSIAADKSPTRHPVVWKQVAALSYSLAALALFGVGLIAPLTPSEGTPSLLAIAVFVGGPLGLIWLSYRWATTSMARLVLILEALVIVGATAALLGLQLGWFSHEASLNPPAAT